MFKSCQYCRHRKKRCVFPGPSDYDGRCFACQHLGVTCEVEARQPSLKRQKTSQRVASSIQLKASSAGFPHRQEPDLAGATDPSQYGDCQIPRANPRRASKELILPERSGEFDGFSAIEKYKKVLHQEVPFIPFEYLDDELSPLLRHCIELAAKLSFHHGDGNCSTLDIEHLTSLVHGQDLTREQAAGLLLLLPRARISYDVAEKAFDALSETEDASNLPAPVVTGMLAAHTWLRLCGQQHQPLGISSSILAQYATGLEQNTFAPHFMKLTHLAASFLELEGTAIESELTAESTQTWAKLEYASLLNVVEMNPEFLDVRDDMPASPAAIVTHMLQNLIYLRLYSCILCEKPHIGGALSLRPVPGVLHFICAIARSTFVCQPRVIDYWPLIIDIQAAAASMVLQLWNLTRFENCRALLNLWKPAAGCEELAEEARECVGTGPWPIEPIDGFSVFWTFRDVRSLALEVYMRP